MRLTQITKEHRLKTIREYLLEARERHEPDEPDDFDHRLALIVKAQGGWEDTSSEEIFAVVQEMKGEVDDS